MWQFSSPEIVFGQDALDRLSDIAGSSAIIISDETLLNLGYVKQLQERLANLDIECVVFSEVEPEPSIQTVKRANEAIKEFEPDLVIVLGGGSVLDVAKVAWFLYERPELDLEDINIFTDYKVGRSKLVAIPTTSGTGAEVSTGVVISDLEEERKIVIYAREMQPALAIIDPVFAIAMPPQITADTGMDAISHAVEAFTSPWHNDFSDGLATKALRLIFDYLPRAYKDGEDLEAREHMHNAATIAGLAMTNASIALGHALAHSLGATFFLPHGRVVGLLLPYSMEYTANGGESRYLELAESMGYPAEDERDGAARLAEEIRDFAKKIDQPISIRDLGISRSKMERAMSKLVIEAANDHQMLTTVRVPDDNELERIFWYAFDGKKIDF